MIRSFKAHMEVLPLVQQRLWQMLRPARELGFVLYGGIVFFLVLTYGTIVAMKRKFQKTLELIFRRPTVGNIKWRDIEAMFVDLGAAISEREGSRIGVRIFGDRRVFHRPHPSPDTDKGAVAAIRKWLEENGVSP